jgi:hypothetical protein
MLIYNTAPIYQSKNAVPISEPPSEYKKTAETYGLTGLSYFSVRRGFRQGWRCQWILSNDCPVHSNKHNMEINTTLKIYIEIM